MRVVVVLVAVAAVVPSTSVALQCNACNEIRDLSSAFIHTPNSSIRTNLQQSAFS